MSNQVMTDAINQPRSNGQRVIHKPITRETTVEERGRPLMVTLHPRYLEIRRKGTQETYNVAYDAIFSMGAKAAAMMRERR